MGYCTYCTRPAAKDVCHECATFLGGNKFRSRKDCLHILILKYEHKYKPSKKRPIWTDNEIEELGPTLRSSIEAVISKEVAAKNIVKRLKREYRNAYRAV